MKNLFCTLTLLLALTTIFSSCKKDYSPDCDLPTPNQIVVNLKANETYQFDLGNFGDEEGASISKQATNYSVSTVEREINTGKVIYKYAPATNFTGTDEVQIKSERGSDGASPNNNISYMTIKFIIKN